MIRKLVWLLALMATLHAQGVPNLKMPQSGLAFDVIKDYQDYKVVATHFRKDKNEIRYILANKLAFDALKKGVKVLPDGSKVVKIGWSVKEMTLFPSALEADKIQRVEYMLKDSRRFNHDGDHWGYARFIKTKQGYQSFQKGTQGCVSCHAIAKENDYLFSEYQKRF